MNVRKFMDHNRALLMLITMLLFWTIFAPNFMNIANMTAILKGASLNAIVAIGFTIIFILGQLDLSIGAVVMLCGMLTIGLQPQLGWAGSIIVSILAGAVIGFINGLLVVRVKINSFIVTLGMMTVVTGLMHLYSRGGSMAVTDYGFSDWLGTSVIPFMPPMVIITLVLVVGFTLFLNKTTIGRGFFVVGGNPESAWLAGLNKDLYLIMGFVICSVTAAIGGILTAIDLTSMTSYAVLGMTTLITVLAAVIIGGTLMSGGKGGILKSYFAVLMLITLRNGMGCRGLGFEVEIFVNGLILAVVVLYEAYVIYRHELLKGQRPDLLKEMADMQIRTDQDEENFEEEDEEMKKKDRILIFSITLAAIVAIVAIFAMYFIHVRNPVTLMNNSNMKMSGIKKIDVFKLKGTDGQPLILPGKKVKIPPRPETPGLLPKTDRGHWWDIEYAGWKTEKENIPVSIGEGAYNRKIVLMKGGDHPYWTAYVRGFMAIARVYNMKIKIYNGNWNVNLQAQQTDQAINEKPDMIIFAPVDATACTPLVRKINKAGIPLITSNTIPCDEAMKYCIAWTGPDDWGQFRMLARAFADKMGKKGGYAIVRHMPGSSPFFARTYAAITELNEYAPKMKFLVMDTANLEAEGTMRLVSAWLKKHGTELKGIILPGDGFSMTGTLEAIRNSGRKDVIVIAAGNSKTGMDSIKAGDALAVTYQSAEGDGALALYSAVEWFEGKKLNSVRYLPKHIITKKDVDEYMPAQW